MPPGKSITEHCLVVTVYSVKDHQFAEDERHEPTNLREGILAVRRILATVNHRRIDKGVHPVRFAIQAVEVSSRPPSRTGSLDAGAPLGLELQPRPPPCTGCLPQTFWGPSRRSCGLLSTLGSAGPTNAAHPLSISVFRLIAVVNCERPGGDPTNHCELFSRPLGREGACDVHPAEKSKAG